MFGLGPTDPAEAYFFRGLWGWISSAWVKLGILWGYDNRVSVYAREQKAVAGTYSKNFAAVASGEVLKLEYAWILNETTAAGNAWILVHDGTDSHYLENVNPSAAWQLINWRGPVTLKEGDSVRFTMALCVGGDWLRCGYLGYKMRVS